MSFRSIFRLFEGRVDSEVQLRGLNLNIFFHGVSTYQASRRTDTSIGPDVKRLSWSLSQNIAAASGNA
jgi:hypothetical protein